MNGMKLKFTIITIHTSRKLKILKKFMVFNNKLYPVINTNRGHHDISVSFGVDHVAMKTKSLCCNSDIRKY